ncbi:MAG TPA: RDD family protein [Gaiellaceae bacterium]|jgi:uncharacterized RDD family membrane protein YckC|nr:RDD family protein [Gaiellaceae bacterium]
MTDYPPPTPGYQPMGPSGPRAGFGARLGAVLIDGILLTVVGFLVNTAIGQSAGGAVGLAIGIAYFGYLEGSTSGQTLGKRVAGIRVIDYATGGSIGYGRAVVRYFARILSALPCLLGYFWMLWDKEKQTWHDKIIGDVVVPVAQYPVASWPN